MPAYDYDCAACGRRFEVSHGVHADPPAACPLCGSGPVRKAITAPAVHYKGSGWAKKERRATPSTSSKSKGEGTTPSDVGSASEGGASGGSASEGAASEGAASDTATSAPAKAAEAGASSTTD
jgi:putative FmdB family regulatory protein